MKNKRISNQIRVLDLQYAYAEALRRNDTDVPVKVADRWVRRSEISTVGALHRFQRTGVAQTAIDEPPLHAHPLVVAAGVQHVDVPPHPWQTSDWADMQWRGPAGNQIAGHPSFSVHPDVAQQALPLARMTLRRTSYTEGPGAWTFRLAGGRAHELGVVGQEHAERVLSGHAVRTKSLVALVRDATGACAVVPLLLPPSVEEVAPGVRGTERADLTPEYEPFHPHVRAIAALDGILRFGNPTPASGEYLITA